MRTIKYVIIAFVITLTGTAIQASAQSATSQTTGAEEISSIQKNRDFRDLEKSLLFGLNSDVHGVIESALFNAVSFKIIYPKFESNRVLAKLSQIALEGASHSLRFKAYLTLEYYQNQDDFKEPVALTGYINADDQNKVFYYLQNEIQETSVTVSNN
ncbi:MAG: hypothetical protein R3283_00040 [Balneolaceae bacterium]|nr:hypothetical protein [Balneolaceae bacterium]